jgi:hypothetical protein
MDKGKLLCQNVLCINYDDREREKELYIYTCVRRCNVIPNVRLTNQESQLAVVDKIEMGKVGFN